MGDVGGFRAPDGDALSAEGLRYEVAGRLLLDDVDLQVPAGRSVAVVGPSGSGKSTLLGCLLGLVRPSAGSVRVAGKDIVRMRRRSLERHRSRHMGVVFQFGELLPELTPVENVALAALLSGGKPDVAYARAARLLEDLGVPDAASTARLSGGERQRTAVARALINEPAVLLADEPTGALDTSTRDNVASTLFDVPHRWGCALVVVTHDETVARRADECLELTDAKLKRRDGGAG
ncbi:ABC transporter ATP-binding protein [Streptomyces caatingaensis]|uniref:ABC transporter ATP-binding protein n=1 Tax=Streptomyces caatingaensis TaxID=1678637 RepID=A0A0K9XEB6_9ACTN|nr:ABC transporter ATP-binding protein [Streptomyces caatingaensis]KNB50997.1 ABC transporter ATP-binding protein [Streptomyces caatingaensis]